jgi:hypothetical protein
MAIERQMAVVGLRFNAADAECRRRRLQNRRPPMHAPGGSANCTARRWTGFGYDSAMADNTNADRKPITDNEVLKLRRYVWADGSISPDEASQLFDLNDAASPSNDWSDFFVEAMCDYLIGRGQPRGYVTDADADWLMFHINRDGRVDSFAELELIVKLFERAEYVPESLKRFALTAIQQIVLTGEGPTRRGGDIAPGRIDDAEVALLRRLIFARGGDGPAKVSRTEAELLFRWKDATLEAALTRNVTMHESRGTEALATRVQAFDDQVAALDSRTLLAGGVAL